MNDSDDLRLRQELAFDVYGRYKIIQEIIETNRANSTPLQMLDVGGRGNFLRQFFPHDRVLYTDITACAADPNFIQADGSALPFPPNSIDWVVSADVLEHIPIALRSRFIEENIRVAKLGIVLAAPFSNPVVQHAEELAFSLHTAITGQEHPCLAEHRTHGLPREEDLEALLTRSGFSYQVIGNNNLLLWPYLQSVSYFVAFEGLNEQLDAAWKDLNSFYNTYIYPYDSVPPTYRRIFFVKKSKELRDLQLPTNQAELSVLQTCQHQSISLLNDLLKQKQQRIDHVMAEWTQMKSDLLHKEGALNALKAQLDSVVKERNHFEREKEHFERERRSLVQILNTEQRQISDLSTELESIRNSRTWRLLRQIDRVRFLFASWLEKSRGTSPQKSVNSTAKTDALRISNIQSVNDCDLWDKLNRASNKDIAVQKQKQKHFKYRPSISVLLPVHNTPSGWLETAITSVLGQSYDNWQLCVVDDGSTSEQTRSIIAQYENRERRINIQWFHQNMGVAYALNRAAEKATGEFLIFLDHDDFLAPNALYEIVSALNKDRHLEFIYSDEALTNAHGTVGALYFRPEYSESFLLSHPYIVHLVAIRKSLFFEAGCFDETMQVSHDYDLFLRATAAIDSSRITHIPKVLYYWRDHQGSLGHVLQSKVMENSITAISRCLRLRKLAGDVEAGPVFNSFRVRYKITEKPLVTIIIPTKDQAELLQGCIESIEKQDSYKNYEIVIVDNNSRSPDALSYLNSLRDKYKILNYAEEFNFSRINNMASQAATGQLLLFLNNDVEIIAADSVLSMVELFERSRTGIVGAKLLYPDNRIQHAGVVLGLMGLCEHLFKFEKGFYPDGVPKQGYLSSLVSIRNYSAVTAACMMVRRSLFTQVGGFDENIKIGYGDIDLCLRVRELGYEILFTPHALLRHHESATRRSLNDQKLMEHKEDAQYFLAKWNQAVLTNDPFFSRNLSRWNFDCAPRLENGSEPIK